MKKKALCLWLGAALGCLFPAVAIADGIAVISHADIAPYRVAISGFRQQINLPIKEYKVENTTNNNNNTVRETIQKQQPDLIFVLGKSALRFVRTLQPTTPTVITFVLHPGMLRANESGIAMTIPPEAQLKTLLAITPNIKTIGAVYDPSKSAALLQQLLNATDRQNIHLTTKPVASHAEAAQAINTMMPQVDAMWIIPDTTVLTTATFRQMVRLSWLHASPLIGLAPKHVRAGCLFALSFDSKAVGEQAGRLAQQIIQTPKTKGGQLESPEIRKLSINTRAAAKLGIAIDPHIIRQADQTYPAHEGGHFR